MKRVLSMIKRCLLIVTYAIITFVILIEVGEKNKITTLDI